MVAFNWDAVAAGFNVLVTAMEAFFHVIAEIPGRLGLPPLTSTDASPAGREMSMRFSRYGYQQGDLGRELDREATRGRAYSNLPAPVTTNVTTILQVDGRTMAKLVEQYILAGNRTVNSSSGYDGRAGFASPDTRN